MWTWTQPKNGLRVEPAGGFSAPAGPIPSRPVIRSNAGIVRIVTRPWICGGSPSGNRTDAVGSIV